MTNSNRASGVLAHPTSFPSPYGIGDLGRGAYDFIDYLYNAGQTIWQLLPIGPTGYGDSPYQSFSAFAGQPLFISLDALKKRHLLSDEDLQSVPAHDPCKIDYGAVISWKNDMLKIAYQNFQKTEDLDFHEKYCLFCSKNANWLDDYALFMAAKEMHSGKCWMEWDDGLRNPTIFTKMKWLKLLKKEINFYKFIQFIFFRQWFSLKFYANKKGIKIIGDIPIFVAMDSADVWANKSLFQLDEKGYPTAVSGVPPDYFSETGQLWGNPLYRWNVHKAEKYTWWIKRIRKQLSYVDEIRIDHFRGFEAYWSVPYGAKTAINGKWVKAPGQELFIALQKKLGKNLPIIAEDLGIITPPVNKMRDHFGFPGMKILQFAFDSSSDNDYLPHNYSQNCVCYTGTHDNDTTIGWFQSSTDALQNQVKDYLHSDGSEISWDMIRAAFSSVAKYAVIPLQDILELDEHSRMNTPGTCDGNWTWRYEPLDLTSSSAEQLKRFSILYNRNQNNLQNEES